MSLSGVPVASQGCEDILSCCVKSRVLQLSKLILRSIRVLPLALALLWPTTTPIQAQGFFQSLFGGGQPSRPRMMPPRRSRYMPHGQSVPWWQQGRQSQRPRHRHYTAMCVRMCDGFYWPISNRAQRGKFHELARRCENSCNGEAKLFYMPSRSSDVKRMTDLSGRAYEHINTAFLYRKTLVKSCTCKPMPWSYSARAKHMQYAAEEMEQKLRLKQREQHRQAALKRQQQRVQHSSSQHPDVRKPNRSVAGRTIIESLDEPAPNREAGDDEMAIEGEDEALASADHATLNEAEPTVRRVKRRAKWPRVQKRRVRKYSAMRHRRRKPKPNWNSGFGGGKAGKVWPGDRPRRRYR